MQKYSFWIFILILPILGALGHDAYITYQDQDFNKPMMFSNVGYLWTHYEPENFHATKKEIAPETWVKYVDPALTTKTVVAATAPLALGLIIIALIELLQKTVFRRAKKNKKKNRFGFDALNELKEPPERK